jgi:hypothetical protein
MNVNILGKGLIPGLKMLAPVRNVDLDQQQVARILKVKTLKVTLADSPDIITMNNIAQIFANQGSIKVAAPIKKKTEKKVEEKTPAEALIEKAESAGIETEVIKEEETPVEASVDDITLAEGLLDEALEVAKTAIAPAIEEEEEVVDETEDTTEDESEEEVEETPATTENQNSKKKNKKNRHNK